MAEFCVLCGRTDVPLTDGVCADCFAARHPLVRAPERPTIVLCPGCGARLVGGHWERSGQPPVLGSEDLVPLLEIHPDATVRRVRWEEVSGSALQRDVKGEVDLEFRGLPRTQALSLTVKIQHQSCPECSRKAGHFYTAILQLRGPAEAPRGAARAWRDRLLAWFESALKEARAPWREAVSWAEERREGVDVFVTETTAARAIARLVQHRFGATVGESASLWGRRDGHDVYRVTFLLRFPQEILDRPLPEPTGTPPLAPLRRARRPVERHA